jgi:hypothetical protein
MQGSHIELMLALQYRRSRRCFRDSLGVAIVVLLRLDLRADIFGRHQPDVVAVSGEHATKMMSAAASLPPDDAWSKLLRQSNQRLPSHLTPHDDRTGPIQPDHAAHVLPRSTPRTATSFPFLLFNHQRPATLRRRKEGRAIP